MATITAIPYRVTIAATGNQQIKITGFKDDRLVAKLTVVSGSIKFNTLGPASDSNITYTDGESVTVTILQGKFIGFNGTIGNTFDIAI